MSELITTKIIPLSPTFPAGQDTVLLLIQVIGFSLRPVLKLQPGPVSPEEGVGNLLVPLGSNPEPAVPCGENI